MAFQSHYPAAKSNTSTSPLEVAVPLHPRLYTIGSSIPGRSVRPADRSNKDSRPLYFFLYKTDLVITQNGSPILSWRGGWCGLHCARRTRAFRGRAFREHRDHAAASPSLILLDLNLRGQNGCDFLKRLRADARFAAIPVVVFTTSDDSSDLASAYANGANGFVVKPGTYDQLVECVRDLCSFWLKWNRTSEVLVRC